jgi:hypothetical protein
MATSGQSRLLRHRLIGMGTPDTRIALFVLTAACEPKNPIVDHPGQPEDYVHTDGIIWTWKGRWRPLGGARYMRVYDLMHEAPGQTTPTTADRAP